MNHLATFVTASVLISCILLTSLHALSPKGASLYSHAPRLETTSIAYNRDNPGDLFLLQGKNWHIQASFGPDMEYGHSYSLAIQNAFDEKDKASIIIPAYPASVLARPPQYSPSILAAHAVDTPAILALMTGRVHPSNNNIYKHTHLAWWLISKNNPGLALQKSGINMRKVVASDELRPDAANSLPLGCIPSTESAHVVAAYATRNSTDAPYEDLVIIAHSHDGSIKNSTYIQNVFPNTLWSADKIAETMSRIKVRPRSVEIEIKLSISEIIHIILPFDGGELFHNNITE